jgi:hypothetical protein
MTPENISKVIDDLVSFILRYAVTLAAIGALSMALLEAMKALLSWRDRFHKQRVIGWIETIPQESSVSLLTALCRDSNWTPPRGSVELQKRVYSQLLQLTTGEGPDKAFMESSIEWAPWDVTAGHALFALSLDRMMGQIQDAADTAMGNPSLYPELYALLTMGARSEDVKNWYEWAKQPPIRSVDDAALAKTQADTYARLRQFIRRRLDAFQVTANYRWETSNQVVSVLLGTVLLFGSLLYLAGPNGPSFLGIAFASLIGGIMAPVAKDLVIALKKVRSGG